MKAASTQTILIFLLLMIFSSCEKEGEKELELIQSKSWTQVPISEFGQVKYIEKLTFYPDMHFQLIRKSFYTVPGNPSGYVIDTVYNRYTYDAKTSTISFDNTGDSVIIYTHPMYNDFLGKPVDTIEVIKKNLTIKSLGPNNMDVDGNNRDEGRWAIYLFSGKLKFVPN